MNFNEKLRYDPETGEITRISGHFAGKKAGWIHNHGYIAMKFEGKSYLAHRVAWFMYYGEWPNGEIDHINCVKSDNRICNLRDATHSQNMSNTNLASNSTSHFKGVSWSSKTQKWQASIGHLGKKHFLGYFYDIEDAALAYAKASTEKFGEFARVAS